MSNKLEKEQKHVWKKLEIYQINAGKHERNYQKTMPERCPKMIQTSTNVPEKDKQKGAVFFTCVQFYLHAWSRRGAGN